MAIEIRDGMLPGLYVSPGQEHRAKLIANGKPIFVDDTLGPNEWYVISKAEDGMPAAQVTVSASPDFNN